MPAITVKIKWDWPTNPFWLNPDNVAIALHAYCRNTNFVVTWANQGEGRGDTAKPEVLADATDKEEA